MSRNGKPIVAIDARLIGSEATGDATYWRGLLHGLASIDSDLRFLLFGNRLRPAEIPEFKNFQWMYLKSRSDRWWSLIKFPLTARRMGASVIHTQYNLSPLVGGIGVTTVHDVSFLIEPGWFRPTDRVLLSRFVPSSARRAARVLTVSETSAADIVRLLPDLEPKLRVTPLALSLAIVPFDKEEAARLVRDELGVEGPYLLTVGTRWPRKNTALAIAAASMLPDSVPHRLVVTGKSGWGDEGGGSRIVPIGYVSDRHLSALYSAADLFLVPSRYEGFGLTLLEAFACGAPVVCSSGGALPEVAGNAAVVLDSWEPEVWVKAILSVLQDSSKLLELREAGKRRVRDFDWDETARSTSEAYWEVIR
jgi:glycosyltransferase involved in cell wall biosynthesis